MRPRHLATGLAVLAVLAAPASAARTAANVNPTDYRYAQTEAAGNAFEVEGGKMALRLSSNPVVRAFGARMIRDHSRGSAQISRIAHALHISTAAKPEPTQEWQLYMLSREVGSRFDRDYISLEKGDHVMDVQDAKDEAEHGSNALLVGYAKQWTPILKSHRDMAEHAMSVLLGR